MHIPEQVYGRIGLFALPFYRGISFSGYETSLRMRLDHGIPLTPTLFGYEHDEDGNLKINPREAPTVKLMFYMYLFGYSTTQIADTLNKQGRLSYFGKLNWVSSGVYSVLRNERHCGDVRTRKTFTENYRTHRTLKNRGEKPQSIYLNHHEAIVSRDDFTAVQQMLDNAKFKNKTLLPELRVIESGALKGFVTIHPKWSAFKAEDYLNASRSAYSEEDFAVPAEFQEPEEVQVAVEAGDFDLRGFEITRGVFFNDGSKPSVTIALNKITFSAICIKTFGNNNRIELLVNPVEKKLAIRPASPQNRNPIIFSKLERGVYHPKPISCTAFGDTLFEMFGWRKDSTYRIVGELLESNGEKAFIFDIGNNEMFLKPFLAPQQVAEQEGQPLLAQRTHIRAIPQQWVTSFGKQFYVHEQSLKAIAAMTKDDWELQLAGRLFETRKRLNVTGYNELKSYIMSELGGTLPQEDSNG